MIKLGLYGCGNRTKALLNALIQDGFYQVHAAFDLFPASAEALTAQYGGTVCRTSEELLSFKGIDAFLISLDPLVHADALRETIPVGKPIFIEKPVTFTGREAADLADLADRYHVPVQVGFMRRYLPETIYALDFLRENDPGRLFSVDCTWVHHGDTEMNDCLHHRLNNFRLKVSQIPFHCCHMLDIMLLVGGGVKSLSSQLIKVTDRPYPSPDDVTTNIVFANGCSGRFHYSSMVYYTEFSYRFHAENYSMKMNLAVDRPTVEIFRRPRFKTSQLGPDLSNSASMLNSYESFCRPQITTFSQGLNLANENIMYDFVRMVRDGIPPAASLRQAARVQGLAEAIELSGKLGRSIDFTADGLPILD